MPSKWSQNLEYFLQKKGDGRPRLDILGLTIGLVVFAGISFWFAFLAQFAGPAVEDGITPQTIAGLQWSAIGLAFGTLAVLVYQRRPIGWYGTLTAAIGWLILVISAGITIDVLGVIYVAIPSAATLHLLLRRDRFLGQ